MSNPEAPRLFIIAGMPRTGTTSLFHILGTHPSLFQPFRKEVGYFLFSHDRGADWHRRVYARMRADQIGLDVTPEYFFSREAISRMEQYGARARVALGVRDPVECAWSLYREYRRRRFRMPAFERFVESFAYPRGGTEIQFSLSGGDIGSRLDEWRLAFGDRLLLYDYRVLQTQPLRVLRVIETFLNIPPHFTDATFRNLHLNAGHRRNSRLVSYVVGRERLVTALDRLVPRRLLISGARWFYQTSRKVEASPERAPEAAAAVPALLADRQLVARLFAASGLVLGSGAPVAGRSHTAS
jgi:hypothetical protein